MTLAPARVLRRTLLTVLILVGPAGDRIGLAQQETVAVFAPLPRTPAETSGWQSFTPPDTAFAWLSDLSEVAGGGVLAVRPLVSLASPSGDSAIVPVAHLGSETSRVGAGAASDRVRVLILGSQHGDERAGYEAALRLARDLSAGDLRPLLEALDVTIVPVTNPLGMRAGTRFDETGLDPNRDHVALASPVTRALWTLHAELRPHVVLDLHEMAPSPFETQVGLPTHPNVDPRLVELARYWLLPWVVRDLAAADVRFHEYVAEHPDPAMQTIPAEPADTFFSYAPLSANNARNAFALAGSLALLLETASGHEIDDLRRRTDRLHLTASSFLEVISRMSGEVLARTRAVPDHRTAPSPFLALRAEPAADPDQPLLRWLRWNDRGMAVPHDVEAWRPAVRVSAALPLPAAWVIEPDGTRLAAHLASHGIQVERLEDEARLSVSVYETLDSPVSAERTLPAGSWIVRSDQARQRLLFSLIEPGSQDGWLLAGLGGSGPASGAPPADVTRIPIVRIEGTLPTLRLAPVRDEDLAGAAAGQGDR